MKQGDDLIRRNVLESMQVQVENFIQNRIGTGEWSLGSKIPSERELAEKLEISRTTVRNAIQALTSRGLFERRIGQGTFVRSIPSVASPSRRQSRGTLGYVICKERALRKPLSMEAFYFDVFSGIEEETVKSGRHLLFSYLDDQSPDELSVFETFVEKVDGLILEEVRNPHLLNQVIEWGVPAVLVGPTTTDARLDLITMNLAAGIQKAVDYLWGLGHRRIGMVCGPRKYESARARHDGWIEALRSQGAKPEPQWADFAEGWSAPAGADALERLLDRCPTLTAVVCANDLLAIGALSALARRGVRVPHDVSVVGFDDSELARHSVPALTTMKIYAHGMARAATRRLVDRIESPDLPPVLMEFPIDLVVRDSCQTPRGPSQ